MPGGGLKVAKPDKSCTWFRWQIWMLVLQKMHWVLCARSTTPEHIDGCQEELLKKCEDNDTQLNGCSYWCTFVWLLSGGRLEGGIAWREEKAGQIRLLRSY